MKRVRNDPQRLVDPHEPVLTKVRAFIALALAGSIVGGLAFGSVKLILAQHRSINLYRDAGYIPDDQTIYWVGGRLTAGLVGCVLSLWMTIRLYDAWSRWRTTGGSLWQLVVARYYTFFAVAWILLLVLIGVGGFYIVIDEGIPGYITEGRTSYGDTSGEVAAAGDFGYFTGAVVFPLLIGGAALMWAARLAFQLVAKAVTSRLRQDGTLQGKDELT